MPLLLSLSTEERCHVSFSLCSISFNFSFSFSSGIRKRTNLFDLDATDGDLEIDPLIDEQQFL
ncbi:hypothetical protein PGB90_002688 [Kerria lacca]